MTAVFPKPEALDILCPMHLILDPDGRILHAGPTIQKLRPDMPLRGMLFLDAFELRRPRGITTLQALRDLSHIKLHLRMAGEPLADLKGVMVALDPTHTIVNLSFGISILQAVRDYALTNTDFAATDLAIEMLYLVEAKTAAMEATQKLNKRLQGAKDAAEEQAYTDTLTGLKNRRALDHILEQLIMADARFAVMHIDLDYFKAVNDTHGHAAGDHVLKQVAQVMLEETRKTDVVARVGGDEFTVILPEVNDIDVLQRVGERMITRIEQPIAFNDAVCKVSASIGTVWIQGSRGATRESIMEEADIALYASKNDGRARQTFYSPELRNQPDAAAPAQPPQTRRG